MDSKALIEELAEILDVDEDMLSEDTDLTAMDEWDSIAKLSIIIFADEHLGKKITGEELKIVKTVADLLQKCQ